MANSLYLVFSKAPDGLPSGEYDRWYHDHVRENIEVEGFVSAQRFALQAVVPSGEVPIDYGHLALYEYTGDIGDLRKALDDRREAGEIVLPGWFPQIRFGTWDCVPLEDRVAAQH